MAILILVTVVNALMVMLVCNCEFLGHVGHQPEAVSILIDPRQLQYAGHTPTGYAAGCGACQHVAYVAPRAPCHAENVVDHDVHNGHYHSHIDAASQNQVQTQYHHQDIGHQQPQSHIIDHHHHHHHQSTSDGNYDHSNELLHKKDHDAFYKFEYGVNDHKTGDIKRHSEERKGDVVTGEYSLVEDDGNIRTVKYYADWKTGFHAQVHNSKRKH